MRSTLEAMPRMRACEIGMWHPELGGCEGVLRWHHVWEYEGRQVNELWAILCGCDRHHDAVKTDTEVKEAFERRSLEIAVGEELAKYPKKDWVQLKRYLNRNEPCKLKSTSARRSPSP